MTDLWQLHHGECLAFLQSMPAASVDAVITDPPYSSGGQFRGDRMNDTRSKYVQTGTNAAERGDFAGDNRDQRSYLAWCTLWLSECLRVARPGSPLVMFTDWRQLPITTDAVQAGGWIWRGVVPWHKPASRPSMGRFGASCEYAVWASAGAMPIEREVGCLPGFISVSPNPREKHHIAGKPIEVMLELVEICSPGGAILDPFAGSASTGVAALRSGRRFVGCEITAEHAAIARERLEAECRGLSLEAARAGQESLFPTEIA